MMSKISMLHTGAATKQPIAAAWHRNSKYRFRRTASNTPSSTITTWKWKRNNRQLPTSDLPILLHRPQQPNTQFHDHVSTLKLSQTSSSHDHNGDGDTCDEAQGGLSTAADVLRLMDCLQIPVEADVYADLLKECTHSIDPVQGSHVHAHIQRSGCGRRLKGQSVLLVANRLLLMYATCGRQSSAVELFDTMPVRDSISWATVIAGYSDNDQHWKATELFVEMLEDGCAVLEEPGGVVCLAAVLRSFAQDGNFVLGQCIHGLVVKMGGCESGGRWRLGASLIQFYGVMDCPQSARRVFDRVSSYSSSAWTAMALVYYRLHMFQEVLKVFMEKWRAGRRKSSLVFPTVIKACGRMGEDWWHGRQVHAGAIKSGLESDQLIQCSIIEMYGRLGLLNDARKMFDVISSRRKNEACWNKMLSAYTKKGCCVEAVKFLYEMKAAGIEHRESMLDEVRLVC